ncbi:hypothetical protein CRP212_gp46 [Roseobacter phage CRP-212]|jgi:hypothetical protein|nr:hypothetical protein CRP212_gp46 [Roseobacter phage CRP-212]
MIAELAAFNAAFSVVKTAINNGRDLASCGKQIGDMIGAEETLKARGDQKKNSIWSALAGKDTNDFEEFMALEKIRQQRKELLTSLQLYGRPGLKDDFIKFEVEARKARREAAIQAKQQRDKMIEYGVGGLLVIAGVGLLAGFIYIVGAEQGRW